MNETATAASKLWGIYHGDREYARALGDPLRTVIEAPTKIAAEESAARLGFGEPLALPVNPKQVQSAQWLPERLAINGQSSAEESRPARL